VDFGSVQTRAVLVDSVEGVYRLVARGETRTTDNFPIDDPAVGFDRVLRQLTDATGRQLMGEAGHIITPERPDRSGVDEFALTASIGRPLRAVVIGLVPDVSIASARGGCGTTSVRATLSLDDRRDEEERLNAILLSYPDVIFITGGTERGAEEAVLKLAEVARLAVTLVEKAKRPSVIYSGNHALAERIREMFASLTTLLIGENIRPSLEETFTHAAALGQAFDRYKEVREESFGISR
jgi:hypothetical protein